MSKELSLSLTRPAEHGITLAPETGSIDFAAGKNQASISVSLSKPQDDIGLSLSGEGAIQLSVTPGSGSQVYYDGAYTVTPTVETQTLATQQKIMRSNVTVNPIPVERTPADKGGGTEVWIGGVISGLQ